MRKMSEEREESDEREKNSRHGRSIRERNVIAMSAVMMGTGSILVETITRTVLRIAKMMMITIQIMMVGQRFLIDVSAGMIVNFSNEQA